MIRVGFVSKRDLYYQHLLALMKEDPKLQPVVLTQTDLALESLAQQKFDVWVVLMDFLSIKHQKMVTNLKNLIGEKPLIIVSRSIEKEMYAFIAEMDRVIRIDRISEAQRIASVIVKMHRGETVGMRRSPRYATSQQATWRSFSGPVPSDKPCLIKSISETGAAIRIFDSGLRIGDRFRIRVELNRLSRIRVVPVEVVWIQKENHSTSSGTPSYKVGLRFVLSPTSDTGDRGLRAV